ncbi:hypothetical protein [Sphingomonas elodea]|uniref:hypothetical protein n=1 Tax=Sphingomonas elodea TaxID=179878 RepID=UPI0002630DC9|nr:hypothetical protein [Sphingomonas elodea]
MTTYRNTKFFGLIPAAALLATTLAAAAPAHAAPDPEPTPVAMKKDVRTLSRTARNLVWCVQRKAIDTGKTTKQCKTRESWIREGADPFGEY